MRFLLPLILLLTVACNHEAQPQTTQLSQHQQPLKGETHESCFAPTAPIPNDGRSDSNWRCFVINGHHVHVRVVIIDA